MFSNPAFSNLSAAAVDLDIKKKNFPIKFDFPIRQNRAAGCFSTITSMVQSPNQGNQKKVATNRHLINVQTLIPWTCSMIRPQSTGTSTLSLLCTKLFLKIFIINVYANQFYIVCHHIINQTWSQKLLQYKYTATT